MILSLRIGYIFESGTIDFFAGCGISGREVVQQAGFSDHRSLDNMLKIAWDVVSDMSDSIAVTSASH